MTAQETIIQSGLALRDILRRNPTATRVLLERPDGEWCYEVGEGLTLRTAGRKLEVPESVFEAADDEAWEVVG